MFAHLCIQTFHRSLNFRFSFMGFTQTSKVQKKIKTYYCLKIFLSPGFNSSQKQPCFTIDLKKIIIKILMFYTYLACVFLFNI